MTPSTARRELAVPGAAAVIARARAKFVKVRANGFTFSGRAGPGVATLIAGDGKSIFCGICVYFFCRWFCGFEFFGVVLFFVDVS
jgi:hypothetical protein